MQHWQPLFQTGDSLKTAASCDATLALMLPTTGAAVALPVQRSVASTRSPVGSPMSAQPAVIVWVPLPMFSSSTTTSPPETGPAHTCDAMDGKKDRRHRVTSLLGFSLPMPCARASRISADRVHSSAAQRANGSRGASSQDGLPAAASWHPPIATTHSNHP